MKKVSMFIITVIFLSSCVTVEPKLLFVSETDQVEINKNDIVAAELGEDVVGNTRVIITVTPESLVAINAFLLKNLNKNMDILFGNNTLSNSVPIRTDHFLKDIIISFQDKALAKEFYLEFNPVP